MGKHHAEPLIKKAVRYAVNQTRSPGTAPTVLLSTIAVVTAIGLAGSAARVESDKPNAPTEVVSTRPPLTPPSGAAGTWTEQRTLTHPSVRPSVQRSRPVETSSPRRDRSTSPAQPAPAPKPTCRRKR